MKFFIILALTLASSLNAFAGKEDFKHEMAIAKAMAKALDSEKTPEEAKVMISQIIGGQSYENRISVMSTEMDAALGRTFISIIIGEDNMMDDDSGWGGVWALDIELQRDEKGNNNISIVKLELIAG